jgi:23S rRNA (adenine2503-C2)-methyltransferase
MRIVETVGRPDLAQVFVVQVREQPWSLVECVGAVDPAVPRSDKMVLVVSTQLGCPVGCAMCDAGARFHGNLTASEILAQIDHVLAVWAGPGARACPKLKIQFARMGEPALNPAGLDVLEALPSRLRAPGLMPCIATVAPRRAARWLLRLHELRDRHYAEGMFQLQFSIQSTCEDARDRLMPVPKLGLREIADFAASFVGKRDRKVTLNLALAHELPVSAEAVARVFSPDKALVKITPLNPTASAAASGLRSVVTHADEHAADALVERIRGYGFECIVSLGLAEETEMGTSCGQLAGAVWKRREAEARAPGYGITANAAAD